MLRSRIRFSWMLAVVLAVVSISQAQQVTTGAQPFGSVGGGPFDSINLGNLNVHLDVPVLNKPGRGMPFTYDLSYDSSVFYATQVNGTLTWQPVYNWGWRAQTEIASGYISYSIFSQECYTEVCLPHQGCIEEPSGTTVIFSNFIYHDQFGVPHPFAGSVTTLTGTCGSGITNNLTPLSTDGSGYTIQYGNPITITSRSGKVSTPPVNVGTGTATVTDANGNQITVNSSGQFFDTLSSSTAALTVSGTAPNPTTFTYPGPSGNASYSMNYGTYNVKTNFACSGIAEYAANGVYLVKSIGLPDGTQYSFSYETNGSYVTGRLASVILPTGGSISYSYTGGSHGIECADGSTSGLNRTLSPGGQWTYTRTQVSGTHWQTKVTTPPDSVNAGSVGDDTVIDFQEDSATNPITNNFYETNRKVYQGSSSGGTLLTTTTTCYNGQSLNTPSNCLTTNVSSPFSEVTVFDYLPQWGDLTRETDTKYNPYGLVTNVNEYDYGSGVVGALLRQTITSYNTSLGNGIVDRPASVTVKDGNSNTIAYTSYSYDQSGVTGTSGTPQHVSITGSRGNLTTVASMANSTTTLYRTYTYYDTGMLEAASGLGTTDPPPSGGTSTYSYSGTSCGNAFPTSISEPLNLSRSMTWYCSGGLLDVLTDENGKTTTNSYDAMWRTSEVDYADGGKTKTTYNLPRILPISPRVNWLIARVSGSRLRTTWTGLGV